MTAPPALARAYRQTRYRIGDITVRPGFRSAALDALLRRSATRTATLLGAWNPLSRRMPPGWNHRASRRLAPWLRRHAWLAAEGGLGRWHEAHVLLLAAPPPALVLARRFRQRAVLVLARGRPARVVLLR